MLREMTLRRSPQSIRIHLLRAYHKASRDKFKSTNKEKYTSPTTTEEYLTLSMTKPHLLYQAHLLKRRVICHVGPTNSGKTFSALKAMANASSGVYCGPLRLLAWEVCENLRRQDIPCSLITGQERDHFVFPEDHPSQGQKDIGLSPFVACTIEMLDTNRQYDCGVIDECQLIGDTGRGWAWTRALLGMQAKEVHVCGSPAMLDIVQRLCSLTGDEVTVIQYSRLSPLTVGQDALKSYKNIKKGDCVIGFSRAILYEIKSRIEKANTNIKCCIIYGSLPPATRKEQARLFNTHESGYDVLVATDAIGMGLNLAIQRIVFSRLDKFDGKRTRQLHASEIKQIGGRAGRFQSRFESGEVISFDPVDMKGLANAFTVPDRVVKRAGKLTQE
jgi:ATP-dependent RNA helicase SUPV3L1/SUV3